MNKMIFLCLLITSSLNVQANSDDAYFSKVLKLEKRWERLSATTIKMYIAHIEKKGFFKKISPDVLSKVDNEITAELKSLLTWDNIGKKSVSTLLSGCSYETLKDFADTLEGKLERTESLYAASEYKKCGALGVKKSIPIMQKEIMKATPNVIKILKKYHM
jgi:hypothetical protein